MTVYELTDLLTDFSKIDKDFSESGKLNKEFKLFLDAAFGYYSDNILVGTHFGSNILYQYDSERDCIKSSFDELQLNLITDWKLSLKEGMLALSLYEGDTLWADYFVAKLTFFQNL